MDLEKVEFSSGDGRCAGDLFLPDTAVANGAGVVIGHGFSFVKEALVELGRRFAEAGLVALTIDYRSFGESPGEPRGQLFPLNQVEDFRNGISFLETRPEVDEERIGIWGTSFGGATVIYTAGVDVRAKVVVAQVPVVNARRWMRALRTSDQWIELQERLVEDRRQRFRTGSGARVRVAGLGSEGEFCAMPVDRQLMGFLDEAEKELKTWRPDLVLESVEKILEFNPESVIHQIAPRPLLMIATTGYDMIHPIEQVLGAYEKAKEPKRLVLLPYGQTGLYSEPGFSEATTEAVAWFEEYL
jgi:fermentation-respiration switch protein FrsA (DUF1100 family)